MTTVNEMLEIDAFDGRRKVILNSAAPVLDEDGQVAAALVVNVDITERQQIEDALRESEDRWRFYMDVAPVGIFVADGETRFLDVNRAACQISGYTKEELLGMRI